LLAKQGTERMKVSRAETRRILVHELFQEFESLRTISGRTSVRIPEASLDSRGSSLDMYHVQRRSNNYRSSSHTIIASIIPVVFKSNNRGFKKRQVNSLIRMRKRSSPQGE
jgi:hypothetical protein